MNYTRRRVHTEQTIVDSIGQETIVYQKNTLMDVHTSETSGVDIRGKIIFSGTCATVSATAKAVSIPGYSARDDQTISVLFTNSVGTGAKLSINGETACPIFYNGAAIEDGIIQPNQRIILQYSQGKFHIAGGSGATKISPADNKKLYLLGIDEAIDGYPKKEYYNTGVFANPVKGELQATLFRGSFSGDGSDITDIDPLNISGTLQVSTLPNSGVKAGTYGVSANKTIYGTGTITALSLSVDEKGRVTAISNKTITLAPKRLQTEDLDTITTPGWYYAVGGNTVKNKPPGVNNFALEVVRSGDAAVTQIIHIWNAITGKDPGEACTREHRTDQENWTPWLNNVAGVKGNKEHEYRQKYVNLTPANIGAVNIDGDIMNGPLTMTSLRLSDGVHERDVIKAYDDGDEDANYGSEVVVNGGGNIYMGAGESGDVVRNAYVGACSGGTPFPGIPTATRTSEHAFISADVAVSFISNVQGGVKDTHVLTYTGGALYPAGSQDLGKDEYRFRNVLTAGVIDASLVSTSYLKSNRGNAIIASTAPAGSCVALAKLNSSNGYFVDFVFKGERRLSYTAKEAVDAGTNVITKNLVLLNESGNSHFPGVIVNPYGSRAADMYSVVTNGYYRICKITIPEGKVYADQPIVMRIVQRRAFGELSFMFTSQEEPDPSLTKLEKSGTLMDCYAARVATGEWYVYIRKAEQFDAVSVLSLYRGDYMYNVHVVWDGTEVEALPEGAIKAAVKPYAGNASTATKATKLSTARSINGILFDGSGLGANYGDCSTASSVAAKTVTCVNPTKYYLATGSSVTVKFLTTNSAENPTLNVNGTGAKPIKYRNQAIPASFLRGGQCYTFRYDGTYWNLVGDVDCLTLDKVFNNDVVNSFRTQTRWGGTVSAGAYLSVVKNKTGGGVFPQYGTGIAFGSEDTNGILYAKHDWPGFVVGGGSGNKLTWIGEVAFRRGCTIGLEAGANSTTPWFKVCDRVNPSNNTRLILRVTQSYAGNVYHGILSIFVGVNSSGEFAAVDGEWLMRNDIQIGDFSLVWDNASHVISLWARSTGIPYSFEEILSTIDDNRYISVHWNYYTTIGSGQSDPKIPGYSLVPTDRMISNPTRYANALQNTYKINGTGFNGTADITTGKWGISRSIKIGNTSKNVNGAANVTWTIPELGVARNSGCDCFGVCDTDPSTDPKTVTVSGNFSLVEGARVYVLFKRGFALDRPVNAIGTNSNAWASVTSNINVNGTGIKPMRASFELGLYDGGFGRDVYVSPGTMCTLVYHNNCWVIADNNAVVNYNPSIHGASIVMYSTRSARNQFTGKYEYPSTVDVMFSGCELAVYPGIRRGDLAMNNGSYHNSANGQWDNTGHVTLGKSDAPWECIYTLKSPVTVSDRHAKNSVEQLDSDYLDLFDRIPIVKYALTGGRPTANVVQENCRYHLGVVAQDVEDAVKTAGLTSNDFGGVCSDYFACYGSNSSTMHGGWQAPSEGRDYSQNVYAWKHRSESDFQYEIINEIMQADVESLGIPGYRKTIGYIMVEDNSKLRNDQPPLKINSVSFVGYSGNITTVKFTDFIRYYDSDDLEFGNPMSDVVLHEDGSATVSFSRMYGCAWLKLQTPIDILQYKSVMVDADYIGEYTIVFIPDGQYQNANPYDRDRNDQILYNYSFRYDELYSLTAYALQETRKEFAAYREAAEKNITDLTEKVNRLMDLAGLQ